MRNSQAELEHGQPMKKTRDVFCRWDSGVASLSITTPASILANEFDVRSVLHGQVSLAAVNQVFTLFMRL